MSRFFLVNLFELQLLSDYQTNVSYELVRNHDSPTNDCYEPALFTESKSLKLNELIRAVTGLIRLPLNRKLLS